MRRWRLKSRAARQKRLVEKHRKTPQRPYQRQKKTKTALQSSDAMRRVKRPRHYFPPHPPPPPVPQTEHCIRLAQLFQPTKRQTGELPQHGQQNGVPPTIRI